MLNTDDLKKAASWAFQTARKFGFTWYNEGSMIWVNTGDREVGCLNTHDFVCFISEQNKARHANTF